MGPKPCADASPAVVESQNIGSALPESGGVQKPINRRNSGRTSKNAESDRPTLSKSELAQIQNIQQSAAKLAKDMGFAAPSAQQNKQQQQSAAIASAQKIDVGGPIAGKGGTNPGRNSATDQTPQSQQKSQPKSDSESVPPAPPQPAPPQPPTQNPSQHQQPQSSSHPQQHAQAQNQLKSEDLGNLIQSKIGQLETEAAHEEEEERAIARAVKKASKDMAALISSTSAHSDKLELYHTKYIEEFQETRRLEKELAKSKRKVDLVTKEKDAAKSDLVKTQNQKQKIETLCRELQKENKRIKEESKRLAITEQQKREELSSKFESTIGEIKNKMEEDSDEKRRRAEDNELLKEKFKEFLEQYDIRERHFQSAMQNKDLEVQLREAKLEQQRQISEQEALRNAAFKSQIASFIATETELRRQLAIYVEKFKQVEETLNRSNELFMTFRREMEEMTKKTKRLEKENAAAKVKFEKMNRNILEMAEECKKVQKSLDIANGTKAKLENLCRALQAERKKTQASADGKSPTPAAPPPPPPPNIVPNGTAPPPQSAGRGAKVTKSDQMKPPSSVVSNAQQNHSPVGNSGPPVSERRSIGTNTILTASTAFRTATLRDSASSSVIPQVDPSTGEFVTKGGKKRVVPNAQQGGGGSKVSDRASENKRRRGIGGHGVMSSGEESSDEGVRVKRSVNPEGNGEDEEEGLDGHYPATTEDEPDDDEDDDELYSDAAEDV